MNNKRERAYVFTTNNYSEAHEEKLRNLYESGQATYILYGKEVGEEMGTPHLQGLIKFTNTKTLSAACKALTGSHVEPKRGTYAEAIAYCKKEGEIVEYGEAPLDPVSKGELEKDRWANAKRLAIEGEIDMVDPQIYVSNYSALKRIAFDHQRLPEKLDETDNHWYWGIPGSGKSWQAREKFPDAYFKNCNKWWCGYNGEENVIIDEIELDHGKFMGHFLKIWADIYPFQGEIKGSGKLIRPKRLIITSNYCIEQIFAHDDTLIQAIRRRFKVTHFISAFQRPA